MRIGIDARFVGPEGTGLGKYTEELILNLAKIDKKNEYFIFLRKENWQFLKLSSKNFHKVLANVPWYTFQEQVKLPFVFPKSKIDLLHVPHFNAPFLYNGRLVITVHDLIHHQFEQESATTRNFFVFKLKRIGYKLIITNAIKKAAKIITPSNFVKSQIVKTFRVDPSKIVVTYEAAEEEYFRNQKLFEPEPQRRRPEARGQKPFLIYVGNIYPHKNLNRLLDALAILKNVKLKIICPRDVFWKRLEKEIKNKDLENRVELLGYQTADNLAVLFQKATAYVFPSLSEGFGIPGLNAMAANIPVVCSNIPTLREIYQDAVSYFDPNDPKDIAIKINEVLTDKKTRTVLVEKGEKLVRKYSWQKMAKQTLDVYKSALR